MAIYNANCIYGYYGKQVTVVVDGRLSLQPYAQAGWKQYGDWCALISYESEIFRYNELTGEVSFEFSDAAPDYSRTTARHVSSFCKEFCPEYDYYSIKRMYYNR